MLNRDTDVLLVIDVQNDFCPGGALAVNEGDQIVPLINRLLQAFTHSVLTQDWHPPGHSSFAAMRTPRRSVPAKCPTASRRSGLITACRVRTGHAFIRIWLRIALN